MRTNWNGDKVNQSIPYKVDISAKITDIWTGISKKGSKNPLFCLGSNLRKSFDFNNDKKIYISKKLTVMK